MNKEAKDLVVQYIVATLDPVYGISKTAHDLLEQLMKVDREFAQDLHDSFMNISCANNTYFIYPEDPSKHAEVNEKHFNRVGINE